VSNETLVDAIEVWLVVRTKKTPLSLGDGPMKSMAVSSLISWMIIWKAAVEC
jgi:hypothetical protein